MKAVLAVCLSATITTGIPVHSRDKGVIDKFDSVTHQNHSVTTTQVPDSEIRESKFWKLSQYGMAGWMGQATLGGCAIIEDGKCITSDATKTREYLYVDQYCMFQAKMQTKLTATYFDMAGVGYDSVAWGGHSFSGSTGPQDTGACAEPQMRACQHGPVMSHA